MSRLVIVLLLITTLVGKSQTTDSLYVDGRIIIRLLPQSSLSLIPLDSANSNLIAVFNQFDVDSIAQPFFGLNDELDRTYRLFFNEWNNIDLFKTALENLGEFELVEKEPLMFPSSNPNDTHYSLQWYLDQINAPLAWDILESDNEVNLAIVDNAVMTNHEDLQSQIFINPNEQANLFDDDLNGYTNDYSGWDVADNDNDPNPPLSAGSGSPFVHGTHCAGIAGAETNNNTGIAGVAQHVKIIPIKCSPDDSNGAYLTNAYDGVFYATRIGADVVSMSFGGSSGVFITGQSIIDAAASAGIVLVAAAGNDNSSESFYPAAYENVIAVGATNENDQKASFSNYGSYIDVMAPGTGIYSCLSGNGTQYNYSSGTSMACPIVAGMAALILQERPDLTRDQVKQKILNSCENIDEENPNYIGSIGAGRVNLFNAIYEAINDTNWQGEQSPISLFPNVVKLDEKVRLISIYPIEQLEIYAINGKKIAESNLNQVYNHTISFHEYSDGVYLIRIKSNEEWYTEKIIKN